jgi:hypothetical protein
LWHFETHRSLNQKEVVRRRLAKHVYGEKSTQYFMETQV